MNRSPLAQIKGRSPLFWGLGSDENPARSVIFHCRLLLLLISSLMIQGCTEGRRFATLVDILRDADRVAVSFAVDLEGECGLSNVRIYSNTSEGGAPLPGFTSGRCASGELRGEVMMVDPGRLARLLTILSRHGVFVIALKRYSPASYEPRSSPPSDATPLSSDVFDLESTMLQIVVTAYKTDWSIHYIAVVPMSVQGQQLAQELTDALDGEPRELMIRLLESRGSRE